MKREDARKRWEETMTVEKCELSVKIRRTEAYEDDDTTVPEMQ